MTDLIYAVLTLAAFVGLALFVAALDRADLRANQESER